MSEAGGFFLPHSSVQLGPHKLRNTIALAPMAGLSDVPFRALAWRMGAGYMVSEMVSGKLALWETGKSRLRRMPVPGVSPVAVQIAGTDPHAMAEAARRHVDDGAEVVDLNFGCPAKKVCRRAAGSALLGDLRVLGAIVGEVAKAVDVPVTVKTRTGLTPTDEVGVEAAEIAVENGARMIVMHARSRQCKFKGSVDYAPVRRLKQSVDVPVMVNGDIHDAASAHRALAESGADGVMIGRAALGQPWIFAELTGAPVPGRIQKWQLIHEHVAAMHDFYGERAGVGIVRKHVIAYLEHMGCAELAPAFLALQSAAEQLPWLGALVRTEQAA